MVISYSLCKSTTACTAALQMKMTSCIICCWLSRAMNSCAIDQARVVILGQDPYHNVGQAMGLSFSVPRGQPVPSSLKNIYTELKNDCGCVVPGHGDLQEVRHCILTVHQAPMHLSCNGICNRWSWYGTANTHEGAACTRLPCARDGKSFSGRLRLNIHIYFQLERSPKTFSADMLSA